MWCCATAEAPLCTLTVADTCAKAGKMSKKTESREPCLTDLVELVLPKLLQPREGAKYEVHFEWKLDVDRNCTSRVVYIAEPVVRNSILTYSFRVSTCDQTDIDAHMASGRDLERFAYMKQMNEKSVAAAIFEFGRLETHDDVRYYHKKRKLVASVWHVHPFYCSVVDEHPFEDHRAIAMAIANKGSKKVKARIVKFLRTARRTYDRSGGMEYVTYQY